MVPHFKEVLIEHSIDLIVVADAGFTQYPFNTINNIPIILVNIFGSPTIQKNIKKILFISNTVKHYCEQFTGPSSIHITLPAPVNDPLPQRDTVSFRELYKIPQDAFVFGRIGRASNDILDTISIQAFEQIVSKHPAAYYLIMSPPPALVAIVNERAIPHVIFAPSSAEEKNIWGFHYSIDSLAHFRLDGETLGLNIAESMMVGNPVITHTSHIWNAHIEYLRDRPFARIAHKDDVQQYATFMEEYIQLYSNKTLWNTLRESSHLTALELFSTSRYTKNIITITQEILS
jgi:glycosyltransferase involved in cell wall biosynthesis